MKNLFHVFPSRSDLLIEGRKKETEFVGVADLELIYREHNLRIVNIFMRRCGNREDAEDLLQDVFLKLIERVQKKGVRESEIIIALYRMVKDILIDYVRRRKIENRIMMPFTAEAVNVPDTRSLYEAVNIFETFLNVLAGDSLTRKQKNILELRFCDELKIAEIADRLGLTERAVHYSIEKAKRVLIKNFKDRGFAPGGIE